MVALKLAQLPFDGVVVGSIPTRHCNPKLFFYSLFIENMPQTNCLSHRGLMLGKARMQLNINLSITENKPRICRSDAFARPVSWKLAVSDSHDKVGMTKRWARHNFPGLVSDLTHLLMPPIFISGWPGSSGGLDRVGDRWSVGKALPQGQDLHLHRRHPGGHQPLQRVAHLLCKVHPAVD